MIFVYDVKVVGHETETKTFLKRLMAIDYCQELFEKYKNMDIIEMSVRKEEVK